MAAPKGVFYKELGKRVSRARKARKLSQEKLAKHLGLSRTSVTNIEKGRQPVDVDVLVKIANQLRADLLDLIPEGAILKPADKVAGIEKYSAGARSFAESILGKGPAEKDKGDSH